MDGMGWGDIIFFGAIAAFIILRYRAMLGEQQGRDEDQIKRDQAERESAQDRIIQLPQHGASEKPAEYAAPKRAATQRYGENLEAAFVDMQKMDAQFDIETFKDGAKAAFEMVIEAFNEADRSTLRELLARDIYKNFDAVLKQRDDENNYPHTTLIAITETTVTEAVLDGKTARITVDFISDQIQQMKDREGKPLEGHDAEMETVEDAWVFERSLSSSNPSWVITQT